MKKLHLKNGQVIEISLNTANSIRDMIELDGTNNTVYIQNTTVNGSLHTLIILEEIALIE